MEVFESVTIAGVARTDDDCAGVGVGAGAGEGSAGAGVGGTGFMRLASMTLSVCIAFLMSSIIVSTGPESNSKSTGSSQKSSIKSSRPT